MEEPRPAPPSSQFLRQQTWSQYIHRASRGDESALASLYDESKSLVYGLALRVVGEPADAEEVTLDVFTQVWRSAGAFDASRGNAVSWLVLMTRSRAIDRVRSRTARSRLEEPKDNGISSDEGKGDRGFSRRRGAAAQRQRDQYAEYEADDRNRPATDGCH